MWRSERCGGGRRRTRDRSVAAAAPLNNWPCGVRGDCSADSGPGPWCRAQITVSYICTAPFHGSAKYRADNCRFQVIYVAYHEDVKPVATVSSVAVAADAGSLSPIQPRGLEPPPTSLAALHRWEPYLQFGDCALQFMDSFARGPDIVIIVCFLREPAGSSKPLFAKNLWVAQTRHSGGF